MLVKYKKEKEILLMAVLVNLEWKILPLNLGEQHLRSVLMLFSLGKPTNLF